MKKLFVLLVFLSLIAINLNASPRRVLIEFTTSNTCQYCGCMDSLLRVSTLIQYPQTIILAMHGTIRNPADPYANYFGWQIKDSLIGAELGFSAPMSFVDRSFWHYTDYVHYRDSVAYRYNNFGVSPVELTVISKSYNPATRMFTVTINAKAEQTLSGEYRINFVYCENNLISYQTEGPCNAMNMNFEHDWVIRSMANGYDGEPLINGTWNQNQVITKTFTYPLDSNWVPANCEFVTYVYKRESLLRNSVIQQATKGNITGSIGINPTGKKIESYALWQNYPNPFNPSTNIKFSIPKNEVVKVSLYNSLGKEVAVMQNGYLAAGIYNIEFDFGGFSSGIYYYKMQTSQYTETKKMLMIK